LIVAGALATAGVAVAMPASIGGAADVSTGAVRGEQVAGPRLPDSELCPDSGHAAVIDRTAQRAWLCDAGSAHPRFPITTALNQPDPGTYRVYGKSRLTTSTFGGHFSYLDNFVAFARGKFTGARVGFHAVPRRADGTPYQPYDTVGTPGWYGDSSGCIRVVPDQSRLIWDHLAIGDVVKVIT
jgi:hypothetical protein